MSFNPDEWGKYGLKFQKNAQRGLITSFKCNHSLVYHPITLKVTVRL